MMQAIEANWLVLGGLALAVLLVAWRLFARGSKPAKREYKPDVLDEGAAPAQRNQALIDTPPAAAIAPVIPSAVAGTLGGVAEVIAVAAQDEVEEVEVAEAEAEVEAARAAPEPAAPPAPEPEVVPAPEPEPIPEVAPPPPSAPGAVAYTADDLSRIKGLGPKLQALLPTLGVTTFAQIAAWTDADFADLDPKLGPFAGRPAKDNWVEQAKLLAAGDVGGFEAKFGKV